MRMSLGRYLPHVGLRTVKTGAAVALALLFATLRGSPAPIFAAIGAIVAMNRTLGDAFQSCVTQFFGIIAGAGFGLLFVTLFGNFRYIGIGLGIIGLILVCIQFRLHFAVPLACIVFVSICLSPPDEAFIYSVNRLLDTSIGLVTALAINVAIKPYNNRAQISKLLTHLLQTIPHYIGERVLHGHYPDLSPLHAQLDRISEELEIFEKQNWPRHSDHDQQTVYLRGCEQLAQTMVHELGALCAMDERGRLSRANAERLGVLGLRVPETMPGDAHTEADVVGNYHLSNLLDAYLYLSDFNLMK